MKIKLHLKKNRKVILDHVQFKNELQKQREEAKLVEITPIYKGLKVTAAYMLQSDGKMKLVGIGQRCNGNLQVFNDWEEVSKKIMMLPKKIDVDSTNHLRAKGLVIDSRFEVHGVLVMDKDLYELETQVKKKDIEYMDVIKKTVKLHHNTTQKEASELVFYAISATREDGNEVSSVYLLNKVPGLGHATIATGKKVYISEDESLTKIVESLKRFRYSLYEVEGFKFTSRASDSLTITENIIDEFYYIPKQDFWEVQINESIG